MSVSRAMDEEGGGQRSSPSKGKLAERKPDCHREEEPDVEVPGHEERGSGRRMSVWGG